MSKIRRLSMLQNAKKLHGTTINHTHIENMHHLTLLSPISPLFVLVSHLFNFQLDSPGYGWMLCIAADAHIREECACIAGVFPWWHFLVNKQTGELIIVSGKLKQSGDLEPVCFWCIGLREVEHYDWRHRGYWKFSWNTFVCSGIAGMDSENLIVQALKKERSIGQCERLGSWLHYYSCYCQSTARAKSHHREEKVKQQLLKMSRTELLW